MHCDLHDYLEIACLFHYQVEITLTTGIVILGQATTTLTEKQQQEFLIFLPADKQQSEMKIPLNQLSKLSVMDEQAKFKQIDFLSGEKVWNNC